MIQVYEEHDRFVLRGENGTQYGVYRNRQEAAARCQDWNDYYESPLDAKPTRETHGHESWSGDTSNVEEVAKVGFCDTSSENQASSINDLQALKCHENPQSGDFPIPSAPSAFSEAVTAQRPVSAKGGRPRKEHPMSATERKRLQRELQKAERCIAEIKKKMAAILRENPDLRIIEKRDEHGRVIGPIVFPKNRSEFEVAAGIYLHLQKDGFNVRGEVTVTGGRLDLVIFDDERNPLLIIEVKAGDGDWADGQWTRYSHLGLPMLLYNEKTDFRTFMESVRNTLKNAVLAA